MKKIKWYDIVIVGIIIFAILFVLSVYFYPASGNRREKQGFYEEQENSLDTIYIGSSSCLRGVSPLVIWNEYGIPGYSRSTSLQSPAVTYYLYKETLKYQQPKTLVLFCEWLFQEYDYNKRETSLRGALDPMKLCKEKIQLANYIFIHDRTQTPMSYIFPFFRYHDRWDSVIGDMQAGEKFSEDKNKGQVPKNTIVDPDSVDLHGEISLTDKYTDEELEAMFCQESKKFYDLIIEDCKKRNIDVLLVKGPKNNLWKSKHATAFQYYADQHGVPLLDFNFGEMREKSGIQWPDDFSDPTHLNFAGSVKMSSVIGEYLQNEMGLASRKGEDAYRDWDVAALNHIICNNAFLYNQNQNQLECHFYGVEKCDIEGYQVKIEIMSNEKNGKDKYEVITVLNEALGAEYLIPADGGSQWKIEATIYDDEGNVFSKIKNSCTRDDVEKEDEEE